MDTFQHRRLSTAWLSRGSYPVRGRALHPTGLSRRTGIENLHSMPGTASSIRSVKHASVNRGMPKHRASRWKSHRWHRQRVEVAAHEKEEGRAAHDSEKSKSMEAVQGWPVHLGPGVGRRWHSTGSVLVVAFPALQTSQLVCSGVLTAGSTDRFTVVLGKAVEVVAEKTPIWRDPAGSGGGMTGTSRPEGANALDI